MRSKMIFSRQMSSLSYIRPYQAHKKKTKQCQNKLTHLYDKQKTNVHIFVHIRKRKYSFTNCHSIGLNLHSGTKMYLELSVLTLNIW